MSADLKKGNEETNDKDDKDVGRTRGSIRLVFFQKKQPSFSNLLASCEVLFFLDFKHMHVSKGFDNFIIV